ncbi:diacylglycerol kinase (ATP) [Powellomyces hirtus]|uniref:Diacylglycerol kinase (ATP) n=1 Tax=Powellomyces hirtus TaxID=109895 RepID=A0A507E6B3_9FUNG|nr:diacylglycerol kinase (ATP) [Powellomyces hirtus]
MSKHPPVIAIYNGKSGSQQAAQFSTLSIPHSSSTPAGEITLWCYDMREKERFSEAVAHVARCIGDNARTGTRCYVLCCGGDGTMPAVLAKLEEAGTNPTNPHIVFVALPFGTANILPRFLGWGSTTDKKFLDDLPKTLTVLVQEAHIVKIDSMKVIVVGAKDEKLGSQGKQKEKDSGQDGREEEEEVTRYMLIQCCIGLEARLGRFVEAHRTSNRVCNMLVSAVNVVRQMIMPHPRIDQAITAIHSNSSRNEWDPTVIKSHQCIQLNLQNMPVAGGHDHDLWNSALPMAASEETNSAGTHVTNPMLPQMVDDGKCEAFVYPSKGRYLVNNLWAAFRRPTAIEKLGQPALPITVDFNTNMPKLEETYIFVDGEHIPLMRPRQLRVESPGQVSVAIHPDGISRAKRWLYEYPGKIVADT